VLGAYLHLSGRPVVVIARGAHLVAVRERGLVLEAADGARTVPVPAVAGPAGVDWRDGDVVLLGMKGQDTEAALRDLAAYAPAGTPVVCLQNGVDNERQALRAFPDVYGICVMSPTTHLTPGVVRADCHPVPGLLDIGRCCATSATRSTPCAAGPTARGRSSGGYAPRRRRAPDAAGIAYTPEGEDDERRADILKVVTGGSRGGGSSWQSLARNTGHFEADYLSGEIVLLARLHGVPAPYNENARRWANLFAREGRAPATLGPGQWLATLPAGA
jgi:2-dehydropantoate 2-reductase